MRVCHFVEAESWIAGGIKTSIRQQRMALQQAGVEHTTDPGEEFDILHLNVLGPLSLWHMYRAKRNGTPVVFHTHTTEEDFRNSMRFSNLLAPLVGRYTKRVYNAADALIAPSQYTKRLLKKSGVRTDAEVVSNGVNTEQLEGFEQFETGDEFTAVNLGLVFERKGLSTFVDVSRQMKEVQFKWFGPRMNRFLRSRKTSQKIASAPENVQFPGFIEDIREAFAQADVFFFPTHEENQGIAVLEAMWCGKPVVVRDIPTYEGWMEHGVHCLKADSVEGFVENIQRLEEDEELRAELGRNAHELAQNHTLDVVGEELHAVYKNMLDEEIVG